MGLTVENIDVYTVSKEGKSMFIDRTKPEEKLTPLHKRLMVTNIGFYYKTAEDCFVSDAGP